MRQGVFLLNLFLISHQYLPHLYNIILTEGFSIDHPSTTTRWKTTPPIRQSPRHILFHHDLDSDFDHNEKKSEKGDELSLSRRSFLGASVFLSTPPSWLFSQSTAQARGLVQFPCKSPLGNTYHFMRAGETLLEAENILSTNPLFVTNREAALSPKGVEQVDQAVKFLKSNNILLNSIRYAIAAGSSDTSNIVARELKVPRTNMVPEFNYMEPRAVGEWDKEDLARTQAAVWAMDVLEAGQMGREGQPPPNEDGTPNETLSNVAVRLRQLLSVMESQYSGDTVLVIGCDGTTLALLSCMISDIPFNRVHELEFRPGEVRLDVTYDSILALWKERQVSLARDYTPIVETGKTELERLRKSSSNLENMSNDSNTSFVEQKQQPPASQVDRSQSEITTPQTEKTKINRLGQQQQLSKKVGRATEKPITGDVQQMDAKEKLRERLEREKQPRQEKPIVSDVQQAEAKEKLRERLEKENQSRQEQIQAEKQRAEQRQQQEKAQRQERSKQLEEEKTAAAEKKLLDQQEKERQLLEAQRVASEKKQRQMEEQQQRQKVLEQERNRQILEVKEAAVEKKKKQLEEQQEQLAKRQLQSNNENRVTAESEEFDMTLVYGALGAVGAGGAAAVFLGEDETDELEDVATDNGRDKPTDDQKPPIVTLPTEEAVTPTPTREEETSLQGPERNISQPIDERQKDQLADDKVPATAAISFAPEVTTPIVMESSTIVTNDQNVNITNQELVASTSTSKTAVPEGEKDTDETATPPLPFFAGKSEEQAKEKRPLNGEGEDKELLETSASSSDTKISKKGSDDDDTNEVVSSDSPAEAADGEESKTGEPPHYAFSPDVDDVKEDAEKDTETTTKVEKETVEEESSETTAIISSNKREETEKADSKEDSSTDIDKVLEPSSDAEEGVETATTGNEEAMAEQNLSEVTTAVSSRKTEETSEGEIETSFDKEEDKDTDNNNEISEPSSDVEGVAEATTTDTEEDKAEEESSETTTTISSSEEQEEISEEEIEEDESTDDSEISNPIVPASSTREPRRRERRAFFPMADADDDFVIVPDGPLPWKTRKSNSPSRVNGEVNGDAQAEAEAEEEAARAAEAREKAREEEAQAEAERAMNEYLDQDDGFGDLLASLTGIIDEDDDDDDP